MASLFFEVNLLINEWLVSIGARDVADPDEGDHQRGEHGEQQLGHLEVDHELRHLGAGLTLG